jgi:hypothetical protein
LSPSDNSIAVRKNDDDDDDNNDNNNNNNNSVRQTVHAVSEAHQTPYSMNTRNFPRK